MKKIFTICLSIWLVCAPNVANAFEFPKLPHLGFIDDLLHWGSDWKDRFIQEGVANISAAVDLHRTEHEVSTINFQFAFPLLKGMSGTRYLYRMEVGATAAMVIIPLKVKAKPAANVIKTGLSGRYIKNPSFIVGGYLFGDWYEHPPVPYMSNVGLELIWPRYANLTLDGVCNPFRLFNSKTRFYRTSAKLAITKPKVFDMFIACGLQKNIHSKKDWFYMLGVKSQLPINKWQLKKWCTVGGGIIYSPVKKSGIGLEDFKLSFYIQGNILKNKPNNSLQDYLRMPIDRQVARPFAFPYHVDHLIEDHEIAG